jgi:glycosyltransferase involved in cell wall biosynthesis
MKKIKILMIADHMFSTSGVAHQTKLIAEAMLKTGQFSIVQMAGAIKHNDYRHQKTEEWGDDLLIIPVNGYGDPEALRSIVRSHKPDIIWIMSDPRFYTWFHGISNEIRPLCPIVWYLVWDNYPPPTFNRAQWNSNDLIVAISKVTEDLVKSVCPKQNVIYHPHCVDTSIFKKHPESTIKDFKRNTFENREIKDDHFILFWVNRNARRKQSGTLIWWYNEFLQKIGKEKATLIMHTDPRDEQGQNLEAIISELGLTNGEVLFSKDKTSQEGLSLVYNMADVVINISDAEGFGLSTAEALACETPIIVTMTGGLQEQVTDGENWFGVGIEPASKAIIGSQDVPFIYEDRISKEDFLAALHKIYNMSKEERNNLGKMGRNHLLKNYNFDNFGKRWIEIMLELHKKCGSWDTRKNYKSWTLERIKVK